MFSWKPIYAEIAKKLLEFQEDSRPLCDLMVKMHEQGLKPSRHVDQDADGNDIPLEEIDPFSFFGNFNRGLTDANRNKLLFLLKEDWGLMSALPSDYDGLPLMSTQQSWMMAFKPNRPAEHVPNLWKLYAHCLEVPSYRELDTDLFDRCVNMKYVGRASLTMGMFWSRPDEWIALDRKNIEYARALNCSVRSNSGSQYIEWLDAVRAASDLSPAQFSLQAHLHTETASTSKKGEFGSPFDRLFRDKTHANEVLDRFAKVLHVFENPEQNSVFAMRFRRYGGDGIGLRVIFGKWAVFSYRRSSKKSEYQILLTEPDAIKLDIDLSSKFKREFEDASYGLAWIDEETLSSTFQTIWPFTKKAIENVQRRFATWRTTAYRTANTERLISLATSPKLRPEILRAGIEISEDERDYWLIAPGPQAKFWNYCKEHGVATMGWSDIGDVRQFESKQSLADAVANARPKEGEKSVALMLWNFAHSIKQGDVVFAKRGRSVICGLGIVTGEYDFDADRVGYKHSLPVDWRSQSEATLRSDKKLAIKTLTRITDKSDLLNEIARHFQGIPGLPDADDVVPPPPPLPQRYTQADAMQDLFMPEAQVEQIMRLLKRKKNVVLQGAPGTGKTFVARRLAYLLLGEKDESRVPLVQFHQSTTYEDFIQGYRPHGGGGFERKDGSFYQFVQRARAEPDRDFVFIIDEINRGNLSKVFGELMMLVEPDKRHRDFAVPLTYANHASETFFVPPNVHLIGTMNTADRSLSLVDYALRRRFAFVELDPGFNSDVFAEVLTNCGAESKSVESIRTRMKALNQLIEDDATNLGRGYRIGHSFFVPQPGQEPTDAWLNEIIEFEIIPLLEEYWCDDETQLKKARAMVLE